MDSLIAARKLDSLRRCLQRVQNKCPADVKTLANDMDLQDIVVLNLSRAVQVCVDLAMHIISASDLPPPENMGQAFDRLAEAGTIDADIAASMKKAVGFRNVAVHDYSAMDWNIVHAIATQYLRDFRQFARVVDASARSQDATGR